MSFANVGDFARLKLRFPPNTLDILIGASVACNGTCLTVVETDGDCACFDLIVETLRATNLGELEPGSLVNYEVRAAGTDRGAQRGGHVSARATIVEQEDTRTTTVSGGTGWMMEQVHPAERVRRGGRVLADSRRDVAGADSTCGHPEDHRARTVFKNKGVGSTVNIEIESQAQTEIVDTIGESWRKRGTRGAKPRRADTSESSSAPRATPEEPLPLERTRTGTETRWTRCAMRIPPRTGARCSTWRSSLAVMKL